MLARAHRTALALVTALWLAVAPAQAQERYDLADVMRANLEPSYLVVPINLAGLDSVWYEANIVAHFVAHRRDWPFAVVLTPKMVLRLFREHSEPVKTPSYMPRLALFWWLSSPERDARTRRYASFTILHHSNGQAGPVFLPGRQLNHENGDFRANYLEVALHDFDPDRRFMRWTRAALEWHPWLFQQDELAGRYGSLRLLLDATVLEQPSIGGQLNASIGMIVDSFSANHRGGIARQLERFPVSVAYSVAFEDVEVALFARYYGGRDYYNIWFDRTVHVLQIGIASHLAPLLGAGPP